MSDKNRVLLVLQNKFGRELVLQDQASQATTKMKSRYTATIPPKNHVHCQVGPILVSTEEQTDPTLTGVASLEDFGINERLVSRLVKKKGKGKFNKSGTKLSPLGIGSRSPKKNSTIREKSKTKLKRSRARESMKQKYASSLAIIRSSSSNAIIKRSSRSPKKSPRGGSYKRMMMSPA